jgi:hypothetical protein
MSARAKWLEALAERALENPYWTAFRLTHDVSSPSRRAEYMAWIGEQWRAVQSAAKAPNYSALVAQVGHDGAYLAMLAHLAELPGVREASDLDPLFQTPQVYTVDGEQRRVTPMHCIEVHGLGDEIVPCSDKEAEYWAVERLMPDGRWLTDTEHPTRLEAERTAKS